MFVTSATHEVIQNISKISPSTPKILTAKCNWPQILPELVKLMH